MATDRVPAALTRPDGTPLRALVVDDEPSLTDLLVSALRFEGGTFEVSPTACGPLQLRGSCGPTSSCST